MIIPKERAGIALAVASVAVVWVGAGTFAVTPPIIIIVLANVKILHSNRLVVAAHVADEVAIRRKIPHRTKSYTRYQKYK